MHVLDTQMKREAKLSTDHHLVLIGIRWWGRLLDRSGEPKRLVSEPGNTWLRPLSARSSATSKFLMHPMAGWGHGKQVGQVHSLHSGGGCLELQSEGYRCLLWPQPEKPLVDSAEGGHQAEQGGLLGLVGLGGFLKPQSLKIQEKHHSYLWQRSLS